MNTHKVPKIILLVLLLVVSSSFVSAIAFNSTWLTTNAGSSASDEISLPLLATGSYNFTVDWGDGNFSNITNWADTNKTHNYTSSGTYNVSISEKLVVGVLTTQVMS